MRTTTLSPTRSAARFLSWLLAIGFCVAVAGRAFVGLDVHVVLSGSMRPQYAEGSVIITRVESTRDLKPGKVVVFTPPGHDTPIAHRLVQIWGDPDHPTLVTKGDANPAPDAWQASLVKPQIPVVIAGVPAIGRLLNVGHLARRGLAVGAIALVGLALTVTQLRRMRRSATCSGCAGHGDGGHRHRSGPTSPPGRRTASPSKPRAMYDAPRHF